MGIGGHSGCEPIRCTLVDVSDGIYLPFTGLLSLLKEIFDSNPRIRSSATRVLCSVADSTRKPNLEIVKYLVEECGADVRGTRDTEFPLVSFARKGTLTPLRVE